MGGSASKASESISKAAPRLSAVVKPIANPSATSTVASPSSPNAANDELPTEHQVRQPSARLSPQANTERPVEFAENPQVISASSNDDRKQDDIYAGGSSGDEDESWRSDPAATSMLNQLAGSVQQRSRDGDSDHPNAFPEIRRKEMPPDLRERVSVDDLRGLFVRSQQASMSGTTLDAAAEAARLGADPAMIQDALRYTSLPPVKESTQQRDP